MPVFEYFVEGNKLTFRWTDCVSGFNMPLKIFVSGKEKIIKPGTAFASVDLGLSNAQIIVDENYYVAYLNMTGK